MIATPFLRAPKARNILGTALACMALLAFPAMIQAQEASVFATTLLDQDIEDLQGEKIGEVDDLVIKRSGRVKKITLEVGGFVDLFDKIVAVSYNPFGIVIDMTIDEFKNLKAYPYMEKKQAEFRIQTGG